MYVYKIQYIGKSNKRFTYNKFYNYWSCNFSNYASPFHVSLIQNNGSIHTIRDKNYFDENFKCFGVKEYDQYIRKSKLIRISKI